MFPIPEGAWLVDLDGYQNECARTMAKPTDIHADTVQNLVFACKLSGEAGEVSELLGKHYGHGHDLDEEELTKELGDVLWYVAAIAKKFNIKLSVVATRNIQKLQKRYPNGFSHEASRNREEYGQPPEDPEERVAWHFDRMQ